MNSNISYKVLDSILKFGHSGADHKIKDSINGIALALPYLS